MGANNPHLPLRRPKGQRAPGADLPGSLAKKVGQGSHPGKVATPAGAKAPKAQRHPHNPQVQNG